MLKNFLKINRFSPFQCPKPPKPVPAEAAEESFSTPLKIVHPGGKVECYYMATPAARILEKYPSFVLARPQVFRQPWDSVVRKNEILMPGGRFFVVPRRTVRKLRRTIRKPRAENSMSRYSNDVSSQWSEGSSSVGRKTPAAAAAAAEKHVTKKVGAVIIGRKTKEEDRFRKRSSPQSSGRQIGRWNASTWQPSLPSVSESLGN